MTPLGDYLALGRLAFFLALALLGIIERQQFQLRATEASTWWASNGRDVLNAIALGLLTAASWLMGLKGPIALTVASTIVILVSAIQASLEKHRFSTLLSMASAMALGAPVLIAPRKVDLILRAMLEALF